MAGRTTDSRSRTSSTPGRSALFLALVLSWLSSPLLGERLQSAWSVLREHHPAAASAASLELRRILRRLTWEELLEWRDGADPSAIELFDGRSLADLLGEEYSLFWRSIDGGGIRSTGTGSWAIRGSLGQPDAGKSRAAGFALSGGFWHPDPSSIFADGFESQDTTAWSSTAGGPP